MCFFIFSTSFLCNISHSKNNLVRYYPLFLSDLNRTRIFSKDFRSKSSNTNFHESLSNGNTVLPCGRSGGWTDGQRDLTKLIVAFLYFASTLKNGFLVRRHKPFGDPDKIGFRGKGKEYMIVCLVLNLSACPSVRLLLLAYFCSTGLMK
jgi:hypothetical protein